MNSLNSNFPGKLRWLISCDESGIHGTKYYGFDSLWMKWQRRGDFYSDFGTLCAAHGMQGECKWTKANNYRNLNFFKDLTDYFFRRRWLVFHCLIVRKGMVKKDYHGGDYDLARRKHFTMLLTNKIRRSLKKYPYRDQEYRIWTDPIASRYQKADEVVEVVSKNVINQELKKDAVIYVRTHDSKETPTIQLCDYFLGAIMEAWQEDSSSLSKKDLMSYIAEHLGWENLKADTLPGEIKFNVWYFHDPTLGPREIKTKKVELKYSL